MACVALASLMSTIELEFLQPVPRVSLHQPPIKSLFDNLSYLQACVQKGSKSGGGGAEGRDLEIRIRDFALKAEDGIEIQLSSFLLATDDSEYREKASQELHQTLREAAEKAEELLKIINDSTRNEVVVEGNENQPSILWSKQDFESENNNVEVDGSWRHRHPPRLENKMVGREDDYAAIMDQLFGKLIYKYTHPLKLIWIVGMPGIGKTILAKSVYEDPKVKQHFERQVWITMPQKYNQREILCDLLLSIRLATEASKIIKKSTHELVDLVRKCLMGWRILIVLDNFWNTQAWDNMKQCFPDDPHCRSSILLTTTHFVRDSYVSSSCYIHNLTLLDQNHSWDIFCNILSRKGHLAPKFENIRSHEIVEKCDGLPQLIVTVAKRLSKCRNIQQEVKRIEKELDSVGILDCRALTFIYNQLPHHLKVCFLYFGVFPRRREILVKTLIKLWVAEGFVESEYEAYSYLQELIDRSLVLIGNWNSEGKIKTCRIHSTLHSFCVGEAQKEGILCAVNTQQQLGLSLNAFTDSCRWLSFYRHSFDYYVLFSTNISRSIFVFDENPDEMSVPSNLLRVLVFVSSPFLQRVPKNLGNLVFLRYLSVTHWFEGLDDIVVANPNLQTLVISHSESQLEAPTLQLPSKILEPPQLRHLELGNIYRVDPPRVVIENLQTLSWLSPIYCRKEVLIRFPCLKKLKIFYRLSPINCRKKVSIRFPSLKVLNFFYRDKLEPTHTCGSCNNPIILDGLDCMPVLEALTISIPVGCAVTLSECPLLPSTLIKLRLSGINISGQDLMVISHLPNLQVLKLENAFNEKVWKVAEERFLRLRFLLLEAKKLKYWKAYAECFPSLEHLSLRFCYSLVEIPYIFKDIITMKSIKLESCTHSAVRSAKRIQQWQCDHGNEMFKVTVVPP